MQLHVVSVFPSLHVLQVSSSLSSDSHTFSFLLLNSLGCDANERGPPKAAAKVEGDADGHTSNDGNAHSGRIQLR